MIPFLLAAALAVAGPYSHASDWPDISSPAPAVGGGESDVALIVGVENYAFVPPVPGAEANAKAWYDYLVKTRGAAPGRVKLLLGNDAERSEILAAAQKAAAKAGPEGTLWFVFVGHGAPAADGKDGLLVGVDAQQKAESLQTRSVRRGELTQALSAGKAGRVVMILDACFSGRGPDGATLAPGLQPLVAVAAAAPVDPRVVILTAARGDQFAGALPGAQRPAFSYLTLGALRGWAHRASLTAGDVLRYASETLDATLRGRNQTPDLLGKESVVLGAAGAERGPDLAALAKATAGGGGFSVTNLPSVPRAQAPKAFDAGGASLNFREMDVDAMERYSASIKLDKSAASPEEKAAAWRALASAAPKFAAAAQKRATEWESFAAAQKAAAEARQKRLDTRDADWGKLSRLLALDEAVAPAAGKRKWAMEFYGAYASSPGLEPDMAKLLAPHAAGQAQKALKELSKGASGTSPVVASGAAGIEWISIPGGEFSMGADIGVRDMQPVHKVRVKPFQMAKTLVTRKQYRACVAAKVCEAQPSWCLENIKDQADDHPAVCVDWQNARKFAKWVGGRLPSESEWEYAALSAGKDRKFPWGDEEPTCEKAVVSENGEGCGRFSTWPVCSKPAGNTEQGLCDIDGNASQWTEDLYHDDYAGAPADGSAWTKGLAGSEERVYRGASWLLQNVLGSRTRSKTAPDSAHWIGFRPVR